MAIENGFENSLKMGLNLVGFLGWNKYLCSFKIDSNIN